jgi:hypothetical protein
MFATIGIFAYRFFIRRRLFREKRTAILAAASLSDLFDNIVFLM